MADDDKEKFADTGEFAGSGVPSAKPDEGGGAGPGGSESEKPGADGQANAGAGEGGAGEGGPQGQPGPDGAAGREDSRVEKQEPHPERLDLPIEKWEGIDLGLGDAVVDKAVMEGFGKTCVALKLTPRQAAALAQFQLKAIEDARVNLTNESVESLRKEWGRDAGKNQASVVNLVRKIDQALGSDEFSKAVQESGVACYASFAKGLLAISEMLGEDSLNAAPGNAGAANEEKPLDGLKAVFGAARRP